MRRSAAFTVLAALLSGGLVGLLYGARGGLETAILLCACGTLAIGAAHLIVGRRRELALRRQFALAVAVSVGVVLLATIAGAQLMFVSAHDAVIVSVITGFAGALAVRAAGLLAADVGHEIDRIGGGLAAIGDGRRDIRLAQAGRDELTALARAADAMAERLGAEEQRAAQAERARRDLVAAASHDLRTPITALGLIADALDDDLVDAPTRERYRRTMHTHIRALGALVDDLFELTRIEAGEITWSVEQVSLGRLVHEAVEALESAALAKGVRLEVELPADPPTARADPERLQRVLFNLVQNAIRHTPADGSVTVRLSSAEQLTEVEVRDTGPGVPADALERVFEPFARAGTSAAARSDGGAGLGLAIARAIVEAHGGRIWAEPAVDGARFRFTLPRSVAAPLPVAND